MRCFRVILQVLLIAFSPMSGVNAQWIEEKEEGWLWYQEELSHEDSKEKHPKEKKEQLSQDANTSSQKSTYKKQTDKIREAFEEASSKAMMNPSIGNILAAQKLQKQILDRSDNFQKAWVRAEAMYGQDPYSNPKKRQMLNEAQSKALEQKLKLLAKTHGLFFLFAGSCPYCHEFAPVVRRFATRYGFEVEAISADGGKVEAFPKTLPDNGLIEALNPEQSFPFLVLVNPETGNAIPLARSFLNDDELRENARYIVEYLDGQI